ncbi:hypothetical protein CFC21_038553 [Triticum aestivum]|uniref:DUF4220 domain-containing protein n=3 Tax=Triticum TaxID=4564 RepID=A0A9R0S086_TRITD|nr:hypothetical protein CFC21_038553 [Triticum aestivum]VAH70109.1 unnamed protein product [Triticum turgidum subsp. durum]
MAADMNQCPCAAAPSPFPDTNSNLEKLLPFRIGALVVVAVVMLFVLHVLGSLRRRSSNKALHGVVVGAYSLSYALVSYTLGLMQSSTYYVDEFPIWAVCLLMLVGNADCLTASSLNDIESWKSYIVKHLIHGMWGVWIVVYFGLLPGASDFPVTMKEDVLRACDERPDPVTMQGYRYVVSGERKQKFLVKRPEYVLSYDRQCVKMTTVEQIWSCTGSLLSSDGGGLLKDMCLSMALSKMLNRRFAGFELVEAELEKTHDFVFRGLLAGDKQKQCERVFRVVEEELAFVHDLYYTRYPYLYHKGRYFAFYLPFAMIGLCLWVIHLLFEKNKFPLLTTTTMVLMVVVAFLELFQLYLYAASGWCKVALIRSYAAMPASALQRNGFCQMLIGLLLRLKALRPWEDKLGQYSLIDAFDRTRRASKCLHCMTCCLVDKPKKGRHRAKPVKVSRQLKQAVVDSLIDSEGRLTNGVRSLRNNGVEQLLERASNRTTTTHTVLVWHIATTLCKHSLDEQATDGRLPGNDGSTIDTDSSVASSLSLYCAYLIAFEPDLLPDHSSVSTLILGESIREARKLLKGAKTMKRKYEKLMDISDDRSAAGDVSLVVEGARLARRLNEDIPDPARRWRILSEFWAEMMLYLAPSDNARAHLEALATGGEFITHLWALLTHAGVLQRDRGAGGPQAAV